MNKKLLIAYIVLGTIGFITSLYLTVNHFQSGKGACDINAVISCSLVNSSVYSEILGLPVALFGMIWFLALFLLAWKAYKKKGKVQEKRLLYWNISGFLFVIYLILAEVWLKALCPLCTVVHVIVLSTLGLAIYSYKNQDNIHAMQSRGGIK